MDSLINWRRYPFVRLIFPFAIGISIADNFGFLPNYSSVPIVIVLIFVGILLNLIKIRKNQIAFFGVLLYILFCLLGLMTYRLHNPILSSKYFGHYILNQNTSCEVIVNDVEITDNWFKIFGTISKTRDSLNVCHKTDGKILLYASRDSNDIKPGSVLYISTKIFPVVEPKNPYSFNYKTFLKRQDVLYQAFAKSGEWILSKKEFSNLSIKAAIIRLNLVGVLKKYIKSEREYAVAAALMLGYKDDVSEELSNAYINTGSIHILAVSGLHVGLVSGVIMLLLSFVQKNNLVFRIVKLLMILIAIWFFVLITGAGASVIRAAVMFSFIHTGQVFLRQKYIYNTIAASSFVIFLWNPQLLFDVGFHLSMVAVLGIISLQPIIKLLWIPSGKIIKFFWEMTTVTLAAQISTLPLVLYYFHQTSIYFLLSGVFVVPISSIALYAGIGVFAFNLFIPLVAKLSALIMYGSLFAMNSSIYGILQLPFNLIKDIPFNGLELLILSIVLVLMIISLTLKKKQILFISLTGLMLFSVVRLMINFSYSHQNMLVFYNSKETVFIDYFNGNKCFSLRETSDVLQEKYVASGARMHHRILETQTIVSNTDVKGIYNSHSGEYKLPRINIQLLKNKNEKNYGIKLGSCVYVCDNILPSLVIKSATTKKVILGSQINFKTRKDWFGFCEKNQIECIDTKTRSYTLNLN